MCYIGSDNSCMGVLHRVCSNWLNELFASSLQLTLLGCFTLVRSVKGAEMMEILEIPIYKLTVIPCQPYEESYLFLCGRNGSISYALHDHDNCCVLSRSEVGF